MQSGAQGVGLLRSSYMIVAGASWTSRSSISFNTPCLAAAQGKPVTARTFHQRHRRRYWGVMGGRGASAAACASPTQICALLR